MQIEDWGWNARLAAQLAAVAGDGRRVPGRVVRRHGSTCDIVSEYGEHHAVLPGRRQGAGDESGSPVAGDWLALEPQPDGPWRIQSMLPRRSWLARQAAGQKTARQVVAANVDAVLVVTDAAHDFNPRRIERYLIAIWEGGAEPVIVINKADCAGDLEVCRRAIAPIAAALPVLALSALTGEGMGQLGTWLMPGRTLACVGSSGVGKSTLINRLLGADRQATGGVRAGDGRGRHTTTRRELLMLPDGAMIVDTPGMREIAPWYEDGGGAALTTPVGFAELAATCRFRDCRHDDEPGCAVRAAVLDGRIDAAQFEHWRKLAREAAFQNGRRSGAARIERKKTERRFGKMVRDLDQWHPKRR